MIGVDIDDVLADYMSELIRYHNDVFGTSLNKEHFCDGKLTNAGNWSFEEASDILIDFHDSSYYREMKPLEGSQKAINTIVQNDEAYLITSRPASIEESTNSWIAQYFPDTFSGIFFANYCHQGGNSLSKKEICDKQGIDLLIEDSRRYALECLNGEREIILMNQPWNEEPIDSDRVKRVYSWEQVLGSIYDGRA